MSFKTTKPKKAPSTRKILEESIKDIEAGLWTCGDLCKVNYDNPEQPMGCALGLVAMNAGLGTPRTYRDYSGQTLVAVDLPYPNEEWPRSAIKAVKLLAATARPDKDIISAAKTCIDATSVPYDSTTAVPYETRIVWGYNDNGGKDGNALTPRRALNWFKRALASLDA